MKNFYINKTLVGIGQPAYIIAEGGVNHNGDIQLAMKLVMEAKNAGANAIKFQTFKAERVVTCDAPKAVYQLKTTSPAESQLDMLKKLELHESDYFKLIKLAEKLGLDFISTPYSEEDVDFLEDLNVPAYKLASISLVEPSFLQYVATKKKPIILSTGMGSLSEVEAALTILKAGNISELVLLHCTTNYPTNNFEANVRAMSTMRERFGCLVGYSDHTTDNYACLASVALGASIIEKHFTLDKSLPGPDQSSSYNLEEFTNLIREIREVEVVLGSNLKVPTSSELKNMSGMRRSLAAKTAIKKGDIITAEMLTLKRPANGILAAEFARVVGKVAIKNINSGAILLQGDIDGL
jgi:N-acetylneuraminate synthase/N,N'-diacetyllegionaminate synthase